MKVIEKLAFSNIESIPQLIKDFLGGDIEGFEDKVFSDFNFKNQLEQKKNSFSDDKRKVLYNVIKDQHSFLTLSENQKENIEKLLSADTFTITTGHQLNLFSGPVFFIYKILQTIKTCALLKEKFPENNFVPIYWMASEDHDFLEINHFKTEDNFYEINEKAGGAVGNIKITDTFFISEFEKEFKDTIYGTELILMLKEAFQEGNTLAQAIRILVHRLFSEMGLLILDGDDENLKELIKDTFKEEILENSLFHKTQNKVEFLSKKYGKVQVNPRTINLFYLSDTRNRIDVIGENYQIVDTEITFTKDAIINELENYPERFSPNALMRPVYQETIMPNLAYIGGNAEIMYWLELRDYFEHLNLPFPILIPRNSMLFLKEKTLKKIEKLELSIDDFFHPFSEMTRKKVLENNEILKILDQQEQEIINNFNNLKDASEKTEKSFGNLVEAEKVRQMKSFKRLKKRLLRAEKIKQNELLERLENLFLEVHPSKIWQERVYNFSVLYANEGDSWIKFCEQEMEVEQSKLIIVAI